MEYLAPFRFSFSCGPSHVSQDLVAGEDFQLATNEFGRLFWGYPSARLLDLLRIAVSVYVVDRLAKRTRKGLGNWWFRSIRLSIGVQDPAFWGSPNISRTLIQCLEFLSEDQWNVTFVKEERELPPYNTFFPAENAFEQTPPLVCLYSGGLDSAAGLGVRVADNWARPVIPVTVWHQSNQKSLVRRHYRMLGRRYDSMCIHPLIVKCTMAWNSESAKRKQERSQRCRSFLFAAVGAVAAALSGVATVEAFESGIGAVNLPLLAGMVGSRATRNAHPHFFHLMSCLVSQVIERPMVFHLPYLDKTKGEVVSRAAQVGLQKLVKSSVSCVHYPLREARKQCGVCPACIFRRQAMMIAQIDERGVYKHDIFDANLNVAQADGERLKYLEAFLLQIANIGKPLKGGNAIPERLRRHLAATHLISTEADTTRFLQLFSRYCDEWSYIVAEGVNRGAAWANRMTPGGARRIGGKNHAFA